MVSFEKVFHLYDFVVDVHGKNYYHDYFTTLFKFLGDSLVHPGLPVTGNSEVRGTRR